jgi:hypothetical protein
MGASPFDATAKPVREIIRPVQEAAKRSFNIPAH